MVNSREGVRLVGQELAEPPRPGWARREQRCRGCAMQQDPIECGWVPSCLTVQHPTIQANADGTVIGDSLEEKDEGERAESGRAAQN